MPMKKKSGADAPHNGKSSILVTFIFDEIGYNERTDEYTHIT